MADEIDKLAVQVAADHQENKRRKRNVPAEIQPRELADGERLQEGELEDGFSFDPAGYVVDVDGNRTGARRIVGEMGEAIASLGDAITARDGPFDPDGESGDGGAHHAAHERSIADMEAAVENFEPDTDQLVFDGRDLFLTLLKQQNEPWFKKSKGEQTDIAGQIEGAVRLLIEKTVELTRAGGQPAIRALLESYGEKDGLKASLKIKPFDDAEAKAAVLGLHGAVGKHVLVIVASAEDFAQGSRPAEVEGNEPALDFDAGSDRD